MKSPHNKSNIIQVTSVVHGFVQMWIRYEAAFYKEMARIYRSDSQDEDAKKGNSYFDYGLFYRVSSTLKRDMLTMGELSNALAVPMSTATRIIDSMVADGYIKRLADPEDRRIVRVSLTNEGVELNKAIEEFTAEKAQEILSCLTAEEFEILYTLIRKIITATGKAA